MKAEYKLNDFQLDALKEVGNIGASHAANALSEMTGIKVEIVVPNLELVPVEEFPNAAGGADVIIAGVLSHIQGDLEGMMLFTFPEKSALTIADILMGRVVGSSSEFTEMDISAIEEIGNILTSSFTSAMSDFLDLKIFPSPPSLAHDMAGSILDYLVIELGQRTDQAILFNTTLSMSSLKVGGSMFLTMETGSLDRVFGKIKEKWGV